MELIQAAVADSGLHQLPAEVLRLRSGGTALSICLLWDDYHRQPESVASLAQPTVLGGNP